MEVAPKSKTVFPKNVADILRSLSLADFFSQGLLVGSWVMLLYKEILSGVLDFIKTGQILKSIKLSAKGRRLMMKSCQAIDFPPHQLGF